MVYICNRFPFKTTPCPFPWERAHSLPLMLGSTPWSAWTQSKWGIFPYPLTLGSVMCFGQQDRSRMTRGFSQPTHAEVGLVSFYLCLQCVPNIPRLPLWARQEDETHMDRATQPSSPGWEHPVPRGPQVLAVLTSCALRFCDPYLVSLWQ